MPREYYFLVIGIIIGLLPSAAYVIYKKSGYFDIHPDQIITYRKVDGHTLSLHVFQPKLKKQHDETAAILFFHGGAWQVGSPHHFYRHCLYFSRLGITCISAQYRTESAYGTDPRAAVQDARMAFNFIKQNANELNIDPDRIIAGGGSAGGHLAATLGVPLPLSANETTELSKTRPRALILYNPMLDLSPGKPDHHLVSGFWQDVSPMQHIDASIPATLILLGTKDPEVPVSTATRFCNAVKAKGVKCELALYQGAKHGFFNYKAGDNKYFEATNERVVQFLKSEHLLDPENHVSFDN